MADSRDQLVHDMEEDADYSYKWGGRNNNVTDAVISMLIIVASMAAAVLALAPTKETLPWWLVAAVASLPAACVSLQQVVGFRRRSYWHFLNGARTRAIAMELKFADSPNLQEFARKRGALEIEMEKAWPQIGGAVRREGGASPPRSAST